MPFAHADQLNMLWLLEDLLNRGRLEADFHPVIHRTSQFETLRTHHSQGKFSISTHITGLFISNYSICS